MDLEHKHVQTLTFLNDKHINFTNYGISIVELEVLSLWKFVFHSPNTTGIKLISLDPDINNKMWKDPDKNTLQPSAPCPPSASQTNKSAAHKSQQMPDKMLVKKQVRKKE